MWHTMAGLLVNYVQQYVRHIADGSMPKAEYVEHFEARSPRGARWTVRTYYAEDRGRGTGLNKPKGESTTAPIQEPHCARGRIF